MSLFVGYVGFDEVRVVLSCFLQVGIKKVIR